MLLIQADVVNGVYEVLEFDRETIIVDELDIIDMLPRKTDAIFGAALTDLAIIQKIENEYGITRVEV
jgi:hypothetical protein